MLPIPQYVAPWLTTLGRFQALIVLLWTHVPRYVTLIMYSAQRDGYPISNVAAAEAVIGDVAGAAIALVAIQALRQGSRFGVWLSWALVVETIADIVVGVLRKQWEPLWGLASGVNWLVPNFYIPWIIVSLPLLIWLLWFRRA